MPRHQNLQNYKYRSEGEKKGKSVNIFAQYAVAEYTANDTNLQKCYFKN